jgi:hypothetical protein
MPRALRRSRAILVRSGLVLIPVIGVGTLTACAQYGYRDRVLQRVSSPERQLVAVCQEVPMFDGPNYDLRLERPDGALVSRLYESGDSEPCDELAWAPDGQTIAVLSRHVARIVVVNIADALAKPTTVAPRWGRRQMDYSTEERHRLGRQLRFVSTSEIELQVCDVDRTRPAPQRYRECFTGWITKRGTVPRPIAEHPPDAGLRASR